MSEASDKLIEKYRSRFPGLRYIECGDGWLFLIERFIEELNKIDDAKDLTFFSIKEKFGRLRIDFNEGYTKEVEGVVSRYENLSTLFCETCGKAGELRNKGGWVYASCEEHKR